jgi:hypothetical protein
MALLLHDTFTGSGDLGGQAPDTIGTAWTKQEVWPNTNSAAADTAMNNAGGRSRWIKSGGTAGSTVDFVGSDSYGVFYKAGCTVPNNFDLEFQLSAVPSGSWPRMWVIWRAALGGLSPIGKTNGWTGVCIRSSSYNSGTYRYINGTNRDEYGGPVAATNDVMKFELRGSVMTPYQNGVAGTARTFGSMSGSGDIYIGFGALYYDYYGSLQPYSNCSSAGGSLNYIKIADPGDLNASSSPSLYKNRIIGGGLL